MNSQFGMSDSTYHVGKLEILRWINQTLKVHVDKIENLGNGAEFCQMLDYMYNKEVPMHKVKFGAKLPNDILNNWKIIKTIFQKHNVTKHIEVEKLIKCKYTDNLEFSQWFKQFYETNSSQRSQNYDPIERRKAKTVKSLSIMRQTMPANMVSKRAKDIKIKFESKNQSKEVLKNVVNLAQLNQLHEKPKIANSLKRKSDKSTQNIEIYERMVKKVKQIVLDEQITNDQKVNEIKDTLQLGKENQNN